jgi:hypothetical protein
VQSRGSGALDSGLACRPSLLAARAPGVPTRGPCYRRVDGAPVAGSSAGGALAGWPRRWKVVLGVAGRAAAGASASSLTGVTAARHRRLKDNSRSGAPRPRCRPPPPAPILGRQDGTRPRAGRERRQRHGSAASILRRAVLRGRSGLAAAAPAAAAAPTGGRRPSRSPQPWPPAGPPSLRPRLRPRSRRWWSRCARWSKPRTSSPRWRLGHRGDPPPGQRHRRGRRLRGGHYGPGGQRSSPSTTALRAA